MKILFDGIEINPNYIRGINQTSTLFKDTFKLGSTVCRTIDLDVYRLGVTQHPTVVTIVENDVPTFTLQVDNVDEENMTYYSYTLTDKMVNLNANYDWSELDDPTVQNIVNAICTNLLGTEGPTVEYAGDLVVTWGQDTSARDFISYVAELNGSYAWIDGEGKLQFQEFMTSPSFNIQLSQCADFTLGEYHRIGRVFVDLGSATHFAGDESSDTVYLNSANILLTDSGGYTIQGMVDHILTKINGFSFYSLETTKAIFNQGILPGNIINFTDGTNNWPTIAQIDWSYNTMWLGGFKTTLKTQKQEETTVDTVKQLRKSISITVDRDLNEIRQTITDVEDDLSSQVSEIHQTAEGLGIKVSNATQDLEDTNNRITTLETAVEVSASGVKISQGTEGSYTKITDEGMNVYVNDNRVAWATSEGFNATEFIVDGWHIRTANNGNSLNFTRK